ncbi:hypothetical protein B0H16DRAFT_1697011 [Mycena metata]|uniref:Uncharacterized protein n=1 Tax=Mycena metata TaxID=1033252 RepID=A0AAD7HYV2_9AGAR|nr:hypothetical protein B0H16DRAFT_1697011 [Mycena metata]
MRSKKIGLKIREITHTGRSGVGHVFPAAAVNFSAQNITPLSKSEKIKIAGLQPSSNPPLRPEVFAKREKIDGNSTRKHSEIAGELDGKPQKACRIPQVSSSIPSRRLGTTRSTTSNGRFRHNQASSPERVANVGMLESTKGQGGQCPCREQDMVLFIHSSPSFRVSASWDIIKTPVLPSGFLRRPSTGGRAEYKWPQQFATYSILNDAALIAGSIYPGIKLPPPMPESQLKAWNLTTRQYLASSLSRKSPSNQQTISRIRLSVNIPSRQPLKLSTLHERVNVFKFIQVQADSSRTSQASLK